MANFEEKDFADDGFNFTAWKKIFSLFKPFISYVIILSILNILIAFSDVLMPMLNREAMDVYAKGLKSDQELIYFIIFYFLLIVVTSFMHLIFFRIAGRAETKFGSLLREKCFSKLQNLSFAYYDVTPTGWLLARMTSDISRLAEILSWSFSEFAWGIPLMVITTIVMFKTNVKMALLVICVVPILAIITFFFQKKILYSYRKVRKANSKITNSFNEGISGAKTTKTLVLEDSNLNEFEKETDFMKDVSIKAAHLTAIYRPAVTFVSSFVMALVISIGGKEVIGNNLSFGTLMLFCEYSQIFFEPLRTIAFIMQDFQMAQASGERIVALLDEDIKIKDSDEVIAKYGTILEPKEEAYESIKGDISFNDISFSYLPNEPVLKHFNLNVKAGETIALVGETGSGKSTIINLLCRFYEPKEGELLIDGGDYRKRSIGWLHSNLGYVLQAPHLFSGSIRENIMFGNLNATEEEMIAASKLVNAHEFIMNFKDGYDTDVGEGGSRLSTGQKQLISFARAVLKNPAIFVLDEATASIDTETEHIIQFAIESIMKDRTSFVVAHRLSTIVNADRILVIKNGEIVENGNHESLLKEKGYYYRLYTNQFKEEAVFNSLQSTI